MTNLEKSFIVIVITFGGAVMVLAIALLVLAFT